MSTQDFLSFAGGAGANVVTQAQYAALAAVNTGYQSGIASSAQLNKTWRQSSIIASVVAQFIVAQSGNDAVDDGTTATLLANLTLGLQNMIGNINTSVTTINTVGGDTTLTAAQASTQFIVVQGVLTSNVNIIFPSTIYNDWIVFNATTGNFTVTCKTAAAGLTVLANRGRMDAITCAPAVGIMFVQADGITAAYGDNTTALATNAFIQQAVSSIGGYYQDSGVTANQYVVTFAPALTVYPAQLSFKFKTTRANTAAAFINAGAGLIQLLRSDGTALSAGDIIANSIVSVTYDIATLKFVINGLVYSQFGTCARENFGNGVMDDGSSNLTLRLADTSLRLTAAGIQESTPITQIAVDTTATLASNGFIYQATASLTLTLPKASTMFNGYHMSVHGKSGSITLSGNVADSINGQTPGTTYVLNTGQNATIMCDGAGTYTVMYLNSAQGLYEPGGLFTTATLQFGDYLVDTSGGAFNVNLTATPNKYDSLKFIDASGTWAQFNLTLTALGGKLFKFGTSTSNTMVCNVTGEEFRTWYDGTNWRMT